MRVPSTVVVCPNCRRSFRTGKKQSIKRRCPYRDCRHQFNIWDRGVEWRRWDYTEFGEREKRGIREYVEKQRKKVEA